MATHNIFHRFFGGEGGGGTVGQTGCGKWVVGREALYKFDENDRFFTICCGILSIFFLHFS
jgi:hypothetical protein